LPILQRRAVCGIGHVPASFAGCSRRARGFHRSTLCPAGLSSSAAAAPAPCPGARDGAWKAAWAPGGRSPPELRGRRGPSSSGCPMNVRAC